MHVVPRDAGFGSAVLADAFPLYPDHLVPFIGAHACSQALSRLRYDANLRGFAGPRRLLRRFGGNITMDYMVHNSRVSYRPGPHASTRVFAAARSAFLASGQ